VRRRIVIAVSEGRAVLDRVLAADKRTVASGAARALFSFDTGLDPATWQSIEPHLPAVIRSMIGAAKPPVREAVPGFDPSRMTEQGIVDLANRRSVIRRFNGGIQVTEGDRQWHGRPGDRLADIQPEQVSGTLHPLWLLSLLKGTVTAVQVDSLESADGDGTVFELTADLRRASSATPGGLAPCEVARVEDLSALPLTLVLDEQDRILRVAGASTFGETGNSSYVVELWDHGGLGPIDWSRIPKLTA
jgi:hypothetical protein